MTEKAAHTQPTQKTVDSKNGREHIYIGGNVIIPAGTRVTLKISLYSGLNESSSQTDLGITELYKPFDGQIWHYSTTQPKVTVTPDSDDRRNMVKTLKAGQGSRIKAIDKELIQEFFEGREEPILFNFYPENVSRIYIETEMDNAKRREE